MPNDAQGHQPLETEEEARSFARNNLARALKAYPHALDKKEDRIGKILSKLDDPREKLLAILKLTDELLKPLDRFTACKKGCSFCCRLPTIHLSHLEAKEISAKTGVQMSASPRRNHTGEPCPFLKDESCSIYEYRPFFCRFHVVFTRNASWCAPDTCNDVEMPKVSFPNLRSAYDELPKGQIHDIREIFPSFGLAK